MIKPILPTDFFSKFLKGNGKPNIFKLEKETGFTIGQFLKNSKKAVTAEAKSKLAKKHQVSLLGALAYVGNITKEDIVQMVEEKCNPRVYSGIFFKDRSNMTYHFNPPNPTLPLGVNEGDRAVITVVGMYADNDCIVDIVKFGGMAHSPFNGNPLHITREVRSITPFEAGNRASKGVIKELDSPIELVGEWGFLRHP